MSCPREGRRGFAARLLPHLLCTPSRGQFSRWQKQYSRHLRRVHFSKATTVTLTQASLLRLWVGHKRRTRSPSLTFMGWHQQIQSLLGKVGPHGGDLLPQLCVALVLRGAGWGGAGRGWEQGHVKGRPTAPWGTGRPAGRGCRGRHREEAVRKETRAEHLSIARVRTRACVVGEGWPRASGRDLVVPQARVPPSKSIYQAPATCRVPF